MLIMFFFIFLGQYFFLKLPVGWVACWPVGLLFTLKEGTWLKSNWHQQKITAKEGKYEIK